MSRTALFRLLFVALLVSTAAACTKSPTGPNEPVRQRDSIPWN
ncbi:MAG TPA: hypothetical protein VGJ96_08060 [Gemmatimonadaceae bacterium]|jgi:hypothetical protein